MFGGNNVICGLLVIPLRNMSENLEKALFNGGLARGIVVGVLFGAAQVMYELKPTEKMMGFNV